MWENSRLFFFHYYYFLVSTILLFSFFIIKYNKMELKSIPKITKSDVVVEMFISKNSCPIILKPMKHNRTPSPYFKIQNLSLTPLNKKNNDRSPIIAKMFEKYMTNVSPTSDVHLVQNPCCC